MDYKKEIYSLWSEKNAANFPLPDKNFAEKRQRDFKAIIIDKFFSKDKKIKILDLGCGWGTSLSACKKYGYENLTGVDINGACIEFARNNFNVENLICSDIVDFLKKEADQSYDVIMSFDVLEHFKKDEILPILKIINKKLKNEGIFIMQVPNAGSQSGLYVFFSDLTHETPFTDALILEIFELADFKKTEVSGVLPRSNLLFIFVKKIVDGISYIFSKNKFSRYANLLAVGYKHE